MTDISWTMTNRGNSTTGYNVNLFLAQTTLPSTLNVQLILHKTYTTPRFPTIDCSVKFQTQNVLVSNIPNPTFITPTTPGGVIDPNDPSATNATLWLAPGESGKITLRVLNTDTTTGTVSVPCGSGTCSIPAALVPNAKVTPGIVSQPVGTTEVAAGVTEPPVVTPSGTNMYFIQSPTTVVAGASFPVSVQVRDGAGVPVPGASVTLALGNNPSEATLSGGGAVTTDGSGIATFPALSVSAAGRGLHAGGDGHGLCRLGRIGAVQRDGGRPVSRPPRHTARQRQPVSDLRRLAEAGLGHDDAGRELLGHI